MTSFTSINFRKRNGNVIQEEWNEQKKKKSINIK